MLKSQWFTPNELYELRLEGLQCLLKFARENTKFYKDYPIVKDIESIKEFPILTKKTVMENIDALHVKEIPCHRKWTGGTTHQIVLFYPNFASQIIGAHNRFKSWYPKGANDGKHVIIWGWGELAGLQKVTKPTFKTSEELLLPIQQMSSRETIHSYLKMISKFNPNKIRGYASSLIALAHEQFDQQYKISNLKCIVSNCEPIIPMTRRLIEAAFGVPLFDFYGSQDLGTMGQSCEKRGDLHLNAERYILQVGSHGEFIWTDLINYSTILIRYKNDDTGILGDKLCDCGRCLPMIKEVTGRTLYWLWMKNDKWLNSTEINEYMYYFVPNHIDWVLEHQIIQEEQGKIRLLIHPWNKHSMPNYNGLIKHFAELGLDVTVEVVDGVQRVGPTAKLLACITKFKAPWETREYAK